jgi:hypothetical protein
MLRKFNRAKHFCAASDSPWRTATIRDPSVRIAKSAQNSCDEN